MATASFPQEMISVSSFIIFFTREAGKVDIMLRQTLKEIVALVHPDKHQIHRKVNADNLAMLNQSIQSYEQDNKLLKTDLTFNLNSHSVSHSLFHSPSDLSSVHKQLLLPSLVIKDNPRVINIYYISSLIQLLEKLSLSSRDADVQTLKAQVSNLFPRKQQREFMNHIKHDLMHSNITNRKYT